MTTARTPVASAVATMKTSSLASATDGRLVEAGHRSDTLAPRASGPTRSTPRSGTSRDGTPSGGPRRLLRTAGLGRAAGVPGAAGRVRRRDAVGALAGRRVDAVGEVRLVPHRVGLVPGRVRQVQAGRAPRSSPNDRLVGRGVAPRLVRQRLEHDVQGEAAERLGLALAALDQATQQAGVLGGVAGQERRRRPADLAQPDDVVAVVAQEVVSGVGERRHVGEECLELRRAGLGASRSCLIVLRRICAIDGTTSA